MKTSAQTHSLRGHWLTNKLKLAALTLALLAFAGPLRADDDERPDRRVPELPSPACDSVNAPAGTRLRSHLYALGFQIYRWNGTAWAFVAPEAGLFADPCYRGQVGIHYGGPTWEANDGSKVSASVLERCTPFPGAIPWLLLAATPSPGHGMFSRVTYIQRVSTIGGTAPAEPGAYVGAEARVPYTAEYYFYRANQN